MDFTLTSPHCAAQWYWWWKLNQKVKFSAWFVYWITWLKQSVIYNVVPNMWIMATPYHFIISLFIHEYCEIQQQVSRFRFFWLWHDLKTCKSSHGRLCAKSASCFRHRIKLNTNDPIKIRLRVPTWALGEANSYTVNSFMDQFNATVFSIGYNTSLHQQNLLKFIECVSSST